ncbi:sugar transporter [Paracoccidioides lutzii Pb01]|uniref:Sugar transporter n=1 Tax=Paracoccidioides lutzii (strain ATCC MYA-826 / Pb01) TaxID=502779 RepID=C1GWS6_PARBA|nr:sugar transporter [Paracoccidioides lutzii Pb01]EEH41014.2 sugar transporter [Paracoccidioides lutzii Pb01]
MVATTGLLLLGYDRYMLGRRRAIIKGGCIMIIGITSQMVSIPGSGADAQFIIGRIVTCIGNGINTSIILTPGGVFANIQPRSPDPVTTMVKLLLLAFEGEDIGHPDVQLQQSIVLDSIRVRHRLHLNPNVFSFHQLQNATFPLNAFRSLGPIHAASTQKAATGATVGLFTYIATFGSSWVSLVWLHPDKISPIKTRAKANALSTCSNWFFNFRLRVAVWKRSISFFAKGFTVKISCVTAAKQLPYLSKDEITQMIEQNEFGSKDDLQQDEIKSTMRTAKARTIAKGGKSRVYEKEGPEICFWAMYYGPFRILEIFNGIMIRGCFWSLIGKSTIYQLLSQSEMSSRPPFSSPVLLKIPLGNRSSLMSWYIQPQRANALAGSGRPARDSVMPAVEEDDKVSLVSDEEPTQYDMAEEGRAIERSSNGPSKMMMATHQDSPSINSGAPVDDVGKASLDMKTVTTSNGFNYRVWKVGILADVKVIDRTDILMETQHTAPEDRVALEKEKWTVRVKALYQGCYNPSSNLFR